MDSMNYLKELRIVLRGTELVEECLFLKRKLKKTKVLLLEEETEIEKDLGYGSEKKGCLWMTDDGELAKAFLSQKLPVLVCISPEKGYANLENITYLCEKPSELDLDYLEGIYRRFLGIPWDVCETDRCLIRETTVEDVEAFYEIYKDPSITKYMEDLYEDRDEERDYIRKYITHIYHIYGFGVWTVLSKRTGEVVGRAGLSFRDGFEDPELGFVIAVKWQRQGLAYEVCSKILEYGREVLEFERVQALVEPGNVNSVALCKKLGFRVEKEVTVGGSLFLKMIQDL